MTSIKSKAYVAEALRDQRISPPDLHHDEARGPKSTELGALSSKCRYRRSSIVVVGSSHWKVGGSHAQRSENNWPSGVGGFLRKTLGVVFNFDKMVGSEFDKGLANLKSQAEVR
jgi:hypothetical protein